MRTVLAIVLLTACSGPRRAHVGGECELHSDCDAPLVCRLGYCRNECATSGDCPAPLACVLDADGLGACQLADERTCTLATDCPDPLVCRLRQCVNECREDRDCLGGARCLVEDGAGACIDASTISCASDGECAVAGPGTFCLAGRCREQCHTDRDCRQDWWCDLAATTCRPLPRPALDGGVPDAGDPIDAGALPDAAIDGGPAPTGCFGGPLTGVTHLSLSRSHACVIRGGAPRTVLCWGQTDGSALGSTTTGTFGCAGELPLLRGTDAVEIAVGMRTGCVRRPTGEVSCWGSNFYAELGRGDPTPGELPTPAPIGGGFLSDRLASGSGAHWCSLRMGSGASCWGQNGSGQLGDGTTMHRAAPVASTRVAAPSEIAVGGGHTCALAGGVVTCFGSGLEGQLGTGGGAMITDAVAVTAGYLHSCALTPSALYCWGDNFYGQLGDGTTTSRNTRQPVIGLPGVPVAIDAGETHTCARMADGEVWCWGESSGVDRSGGDDLQLPTPRRVWAFADEVHAGSESTCARIADRVECLGRYAFQAGWGETGGLPPYPVEVQLP